MLLVDLLQVPVDGAFRDVSSHRAMSRTLLPSANQTATRLSIDVSPRVLATKPGSDPTPAPRLDNQGQRGDMPRSVVRLVNPDGFDWTTNGGKPDGRASSIDPLTATAPEAGNATPTSRSRRTWSAGARARSTPSAV